MAGPLSGLRVVELAGQGPTPLACMLLADLGADVVRVDRAVGSAWHTSDPVDDVFGRGRRSIALDLKDQRGVDLALRLIERSDVLIEGFRPGVTERLGLGPQVCLERQPRLIYGRMTGWGQDGPLATTAGHDINYLALSGALHAIGQAGGPPVPPLNLVGDGGGGGMLLAFGIVSALHAVNRTGRGQVVDVAMIDGVAALLAPFYTAAATGGWGPRGTNLVDGGAPFYTVYETADDQYVAVGALEPVFYRELLKRLGLNEFDPDRQMNRDEWPTLRIAMAAVFATRTREEWVVEFADADACVTPVLSLAEAPGHPHHVARRAFVNLSDRPHPTSAPRFGHTRPEDPRPAPAIGEHTDAVLAELGLTTDEVAAAKLARYVA
ncbi:CaiB/BaiF CoA transferase family protein [Nocardia sp. CA-135398]|uniref:CaiB/BaiF CoA transferase family protein n=1 Tax=Nocardia sp. CA-135398 TaxID=3239977 RepID=UPI003D9761A4